jgi:hypothetical protein
MDIEIDAEAKDKRLNRLVALTVVVMSIFMGLSQVKDGNIVQAMAQAQSNAGDRGASTRRPDQAAHRRDGVGAGEATPGLAPERRA